MVIQFHGKVRYHPKVRGNSQGMQCDMLVL